MLEELKIENFRRFKKLEFTRLKRVNLIAGKNNTGKTGVLEALLMLLDNRWGEQLATAFRNCTNIGNATENYWKWLFRNRETSLPIILMAETEEYRDYTRAFGFPGTQLPAGYSGWSGGHNLRVGMRNAVSKKTGGPVERSELTCGVVPLWVRPTGPQKDAIDYDRVVLKAGGEER